jgi:hypothetical protein
MVTYSPMWKWVNVKLRGFWDRVFGIPKDKDWHLKVDECIVVAVRDPISRFLSSYNEIESRISRLSQWRESTANTWPFGRFKADSRERFQQMITDILDCPIERHYKGINFTYPKTLELQHLYSMTCVLKLLASFNMSINLHYLPSLEDLQHSWPRFVVESCPGSFSNATATRILITEMNISRGNHESSRDFLGTYATAKRVWS